MKKQAIMFAIAASALMLGACAGTPTAQPAAAQSSALAPEQSPAQVAAQLCPPLIVAVQGLQMDSGLPAGALKDLAAAAPQVQAWCSAASLISGSDLQSLESLAFQVVLPIAQQSDPKLGAELLALQIVLSAVQAGAMAPASPAAAEAGNSTVPTVPVGATAK